MKTAFAIVMSLSLGAAAYAADLTRAVTVTEDGVAEQYLGTQFGQTLYTFDLDQNGTSACNAVCAEKWPPIVVNSEEAAALAAPFGVITRDSKLLQLTYEGKPVYTFYLDHAEGENKGDGVGGVWHDIDFK